MPEPGILRYVEARVAWVYEFGGLQIQSAVSLPGLGASVEPGTRPAVRVLVERGCPLPTQPPVVSWRGVYELTLSPYGTAWLMSTRDHGSFLVSEDGREVRCYPDGASGDWADVVVRRILPRLMQRHGRVVLHGSALSDGRSAAVFLGPSRRGKSTLAAALKHYLGWSVLSDDLAAIDPRCPAPLCPAVGAGLCLLPDSLARFAPWPADCRRVAGHEDKRWQTETADSESIAPRPLRSIFLLVSDTPSSIPSLASSTSLRRRATGDDVGVSIWRVPPVEAARQLSTSQIHFNPADIVARGQSWQALGRIVSQVPTFAMTYPRRYQCLPAVVEALRDLLADPARLTI